MKNEPKKVFPSKVSYYFLAIILIAILLPMIYILKEPHNFIHLIVPLLSFFAILNLFLTIKYTIIGNTLNVKVSFWFNQNIDINTIKEIKKTRSLLSSPAASVTDRILIKYGKYNQIILSPKDKHNFIKTLISINPEIENKVVLE